MPDPSVSTDGNTRRDIRDLIAPTGGVSPAEQVFFPFVANRSWYVSYWYEDSEKRPRWLGPRLARLVLRCARAVVAVTRSVRSEPAPIADAEASTIQSRLQIDPIDGSADLALASRFRQRQRPRVFAEKTAHSL
jgi:hypothetical protein